MFVLDNEITFVTLAQALAPSVIISFLLGLREGLKAVGQNTYASLSRYGWSYFALPLVTTSLAGSVLGGSIITLVVGLGLAPELASQIAASLVLGSASLIEGIAWLGDFRKNLRDVGTGLATRRRVVAAGSLLVPGGVTIATSIGATGSTYLWNAFGVGASIVSIALVFACSLVLVSTVRREFRLAVPFGRRARPEAKVVLAAGRQNHPSIVLISIDTLRADRIGAYGSRATLTPNIDWLASEGVVCEAAIASSSWTLPSIASVLTALVPSRHGAGWPQHGFDLLARQPIATGSWTVTQALNDAGYATHAVVANPYLAIHYGTAAGFDTYENVSIESELLEGLRPTLAGRLLGHTLERRLSDSGGGVTARGLARLRSLSAERLTRGEPFFLWLHYVDPHPPYGSVRNKSFRGDTLLSRKRRSSQGAFDAIARLRAGEIRLSPAEKEELQRLYERDVAAVDGEVGRILDSLLPSSPGGADRRREVPEDMVVVVVADHGEEFWDHGGVEHGHTFYDELVRVPLILAGARLPKQTRLSELVGLVDLSPTLLSVVGVDVPQGLDGVSFVARRADVPVLSPATDAVLCESLLFAEEKVALRTNRYKYILWDNGKEECYDLVRDPLELVDVAASVSLSRSREIVKRRRQSSVGEGEVCSAEDAATRVALRGLGYIS